jgi:hypothetical protein
MLVRWALAFAREDRQPIKTTMSDRMLRPLYKLQQEWALPISETLHNNETGRYFHRNAYLADVEKRRDCSTF